MSSTARQVPGLASRARSSASMATMPPSPRLSARMIRMAYFTDTTRTSDHRITETAPTTAAGSGRPVPALAAFTASFRA